MWFGNRPQRSQTGKSSQPAKVCRLRVNHRAGDGAHGTEPDHSDAVERRGDLIRSRQAGQLTSRVCSTDSASRSIILSGNKTKFEPGHRALGTMRPSISRKRAAAPISMVCTVSPRRKPSGSAPKGISESRSAPTDPARVYVHQHDAPHSNFPASLGLHRWVLR